MSSSDWDLTFTWCSPDANPFPISGSQWRGQDHKHLPNCWDQLLLSLCTDSWHRLYRWNPKTHTETRFQRKPFVYLNLIRMKLKLKIKTYEAKKELRNGLDPGVRIMGIKMVMRVIQSFWSGRTRQKGEKKKKSKNLNWRPLKSGIICLLNLPWHQMRWMRWRWCPDDRGRWWHSTWINIENRPIGPHVISCFHIFFKINPSIHTNHTILRSS